MKRRKRTRRRYKKKKVRKYTLGEKLAYADKLRKRLTPAEKALWEKLKNCQVGICSYYPQVVVEGYIPDFVDKDSKKIVEVDGGIHRYQKYRDQKRQKHLEKAGYSVIRFSNSEVLNDVCSVVERILKF